MKVIKDRKEKDESLCIILKFIIIFLNIIKYVYWIYIDIF